MTRDIIIKLNQLNEEFYRITAEDFNDSRQYFWQGWEKLKPLLSSSKAAFNILDVGCGNGRFAQFIGQHLSNFTYVGWDSSQELLELAQQKNTSLPTQFLKLDVVDALLNDEWPDQTTPFELVTLFGVLHHVPSFELRKKILHKLGTLINESGYLVVATWQFVNDEKLMSRQVDPETIGLETNQLESDDYLLDWQRGTSATRYCHYVSDQEFEELLEGSNLTIQESYAADGSNNQMNHYFILVKSN